MIQNLKEITRDNNLDLPTVIFSEPIAGDVFRSYVDISKAKNLIGFSIKKDLKLGISETFKWFLKNI